MIKAVIFDWFGLRSEDALKRLVRELRKNIKRNEEDIINSYKKYELDFTLRRINSKNVLKNMFRDLNLNQNINDYLYIFNKTSKIRNEILKLAKMLKKGYKTALLSDNFDEMTKTIRKNIDLKDYFDMVIFSNEIRLVKRKDKIYKVTIKKLKCEPSECVLIDDKKENIARAKRLDMNGILFKNIRQVKRELIKFNVKF